MRALLVGGLASLALVAPAGAAAPTGTPPMLTAFPATSGLLEVGQTLTVTTGTWTGTPPMTFSYQWQRCNGPCADISGASGSSLKLTTLELGDAVRVLVTATNSAGIAQAYSRSSAYPIQIPGDGKIPHLGKMEAQLRRAAAPIGRAASVRQLLKANGYRYSFDMQAAGQVVVGWFATLRPGARPVKLAGADFAQFYTGPYRGLKVNLTHRGRSLLKHEHHLQVTCKAAWVSADNPQSLYPVLVTETRVF